MRNKKDIEGFLNHVAKRPQIYTVPLIKLSLELMDLYWDFDFKYIESNELLEIAIVWANKNSKRYFEDPSFIAFNSKRA